MAVRMPARDCAWPGNSGACRRSQCDGNGVDELLPTIEPIILGGGKTIFAENGKAIPVTLESTAKAGTGAQVCLYVRARQPPFLPGPTGDCSRRG